MAVIGRVSGVELLEGIEREDHVIRSDRVAVMPFSLRPQTIDHEGKIVGVANGFGQRAVFGRDFVERLRHEGLIDKPDGTGDLSLHTRDDHVEIVEGADGDLPNGTALGRVRIDVIEALEVGGILDVAEQRQRMAPRELAGRLRLGSSDDGKARHRAEGGERSKCSAGEQEIASGNGQINIPVLKEVTPLSAQYRRGFDGICCFFLMLEGRTACQMRPNAPITTSRGPNTETARL